MNKMSEETNTPHDEKGLARVKAAAKRSLQWVRSHRMQSGLVGGMALVLLIVIVAVKATGKKEPPPTPVAKRAVEAMVLRPREEVVDSLTEKGRVEVNRVVRVSAEVAGRVERYAGRDDRFEASRLVTTDSPPLDEGDVVRKGQPIIVLNRELLQAARDAAQAEYEYLTEEVRRMKNSFEAGVATTLEVDQVMMKYNMARANLAAAEARLDRTVVRAKADGVLNALPAEVGEYVQPGQVVAEIVDADPAKIIVGVSEKDIGYFRVGETHRIVYGVDADQEVQGRITYISELADPATLTTRMELTVPNPKIDGQRRLRDSDMVDVVLVRRVLKDELMIPLRAVTPLERGHVCYVAVDGKAQRRWVNLDRQMLMGEEVRVLPLTPAQQRQAEQADEKAGLEPGEVLILQPGRVGPGQPVTLVDLQGNPGVFDPAAPAAQPATQPATQSAANPARSPLQ